MTKPWGENNELFSSELKGGYDYQIWFATQLLREGLTVHVPPYVCLPTMEGHEAFKDDHDITVGSTQQLWLEVKSVRKVPFTSVLDIPRSQIVCTVKSWDQLETKPLGIVIINRHNKAVVFAPAKYAGDWEKKRIKDNLRNMTDTFYIARKEHFHSYEDLIKVLKARTR